MKIIKDAKTSLLLKSFLLDNRDYLSVSIFYYFDFNNPNTPLEEQAMYGDLKEQLGKTMLDYAMPKPKAEVLACGKCYNTTPQSGASHVKLEVGEIQKELYVFGERRWNNTLITEPLPFKTIPIDFEHATGSGDLLPNVEDPDHLTTTKNSKNIAASFMPIDITDKENMKKLGTFDERYKAEFWPGFAADMDYGFFNVAPLNQQQDSFFEGGELIKITNMNREKKLLTSYIPQTYFRCFATLIDNDKDDEFKEIKLHRDTLWLFPELQKGVVIFRGTLEVSDEIYSNIKYLNIKSVFEDDEVKTLHEYHELQKKELDKSVEIDNAPFEEMEKEIEEFNKEIFDIPREIKMMVDEMQGKKPTLKNTPSQLLEQSNEMTDSAIKQIESSKKALESLKEEFGHILKVDTTMFNNAKNELLESKERIKSAFEMKENALQMGEKLKSDISLDMQNMKNNLKNQDYLEDDFSLDFLKEKEKIWSDYGFDFLCDSVHILRKKPEVLHKIHHLGLAKRTIEKGWIGFNDEKKTLKAGEWGLEDTKDIILKEGLVTARFEDSFLKSLRIDNELILGSQEEYELFLSEENYTFPLFYFKNDELQALLCDQEAFDICNSLVCDDISSVVRDDTKEALQKASVIFYLKEDGVVEKLPHAKKFDCGEYENLFELHQNGLEIRGEIIRNLPKEISETLSLKRDISTAAIMEKSDNFLKKLKMDLNDKAQKIETEMKTHRDEALLKANEVLKSKGLSPIDLDTTVKDDGFMKASDVENDFNKAIEALIKKDAKESDIDLQAKIAQLQEVKKESVAFAKEGEMMYAQGVQKIASAKENAKEPIPQWAKEMMQKAGIDPENPHKKALSREDVVELYSKGNSFEGEDLSNLDLSNLNLSGIDLTKAECKKTNFSNTNLSGAKMDQASFSDTNFTKANISSSNINMAIFNKSILEQTILDDIFADMAYFEGMVIKKSSFVNATLDSVIFEDVVVDDVVFDNCSFLNTSFLKVSLKDSDFSSSNFKGSVFSESNLKDSKFLDIDSKSTLFYKTTVVNCDFSRAKLYNTRILKQSYFNRCSLVYADMQKSTIFDASLDECNLEKANLSRCLIKKATINKCNFKGIVAKSGRFEYSIFKESFFNGINLFRGSLRGVDLKICDFSDANLYGVEFYKTKFYEVKLFGANLKRSNLEDRMELIYD